MQCPDYARGRKRREAYQKFLPMQQIQNISKPLNKTLIASTALQKYHSTPRSKVRHLSTKAISTMDDFVGIDEPRLRSFRID